MDFIRRSALVLACGAALTAPAATAASAATGPGSPPGPAPSATFCGTGWDGGLAVYTGDRALCPTALKVAKAFHAAARHDPTSEKPLSVQVGGVPWRCETREGSPNPYIACVNRKDPGQQFTLNS
ncbi:hypothetical protein [Streptomyces sp. NPDC031705]|uniref:hypothetical protein n=1 Tax=Streptomyces sp. NPDC031705 TaxID=3155729 RepID=UPI0033DF10B8